MGKTRDQAISVSWSELDAAIKSNPQRDARLQSGAASASITILPPDSRLGWLNEWTEDTTCTITDAVSFALWVCEPLYRIATGPIRRSMEMEEASSLLHASEAAWKQHNGRVRGWVRKHLEEDLRLRAGGGAEAPDAWESIRTTKRAALLLDYVCVMRGLRVALWWPDHKAVSVVPLTSSATHITQLNCLSGRILLGPSSETGVAGKEWPALLLKASSDFVWGPPASAPSIGAQTVAQINERILSMPDGAAVPRTGGRTALWNRLMWLTLLASLNGVDEALTASKT